MIITDEVERRFRKRLAEEIAAITDNILHGFTTPGADYQLAFDRGQIRMAEMALEILDECRKELDEMA